MRRQIVVAALAVMALHPQPKADVSLEVIEYRLLQPVGQVRLTTGFVHDPTVQGKMLADLASFDRQGLILVAGDTVRHFTRRETIGAHSVETLLSIYPAAGRGYRGGLASASIVVTVDGKKRIDCPYTYGPTDLADVGILPLDGMISIHGSHHDKAVEGLIDLSRNEAIDAAWLDRNAR